MEQTEAPASVSLLLLLLFPPFENSPGLVIGRPRGGGENEGLRPIDARNSGPVILSRAASFFAAAAAAALSLLPLRGALAEAAAAATAAAETGAAAAVAMRSYPFPTLTVLQAGSQLPVGGGGEGGGGDGGLGVGRVAVGRPKRVRRAFGAGAERGWGCC